MTSDATFSSGGAVLCLEALPTTFSLLTSAWAFVYNFPLVLKILHTFQIAPDYQPGTSIVVQWGTRLCND